MPSLHKFPGRIHPIVLPLPSLPQMPYLRYVTTCHPGGSGQTFQSHSRLFSFKTQRISKPHGCELPPPTSNWKPATCHQPPCEGRVSHQPITPGPQNSPPCPAPCRRPPPRPLSAPSTTHRDTGLSSRHARPPPAPDEMRSVTPSCCRFGFPRRQ